MSRHLCHADGCLKVVPPELLMCGRHWKLVPSPLQRNVWRTYRRGQEIDKRPSTEYLAAARAAIDAVGAAEARQPRLF